MTMIERVAKIIQDGVVSGDSSWNEIAHAAIMAMREPTKEMTKSTNAGQERSKRYWQDMIDAALKE